MIEMGWCGVSSPTFLSHYSSQWTYQMSFLYLIKHKNVLFYTSSIILEKKCSDAFVQGKIVLKNKGLVIINHGEERAPKRKVGQVKF